MNVLAIILIVFLAIILFKIGIRLLRFIISLGILALCIYLIYQGILWISENYQQFLN
ncbi:CvpA family protein [Staphylococcus argensis]|nr:hypothetical protein COR53_11110 [Staphylococcus pettenkoferi]